MFGAIFGLLLFLTYLIYSQLFHNTIIGQQVVPAVPNPTPPSTPTTSSPAPASFFNRQHILTLSHDPREIGRVLQKIKHKTFFQLPRHVPEPRRPATP